MRPDDDGRWEPGTVIALREVHDGRVRSARPLRIVFDEGDAIVGFLVPGSTVAWPRRPDGSVSRTPNVGWELSLERWQGPGALWILPAETGWAATLHLDAHAGEPQGWKVNFQEPWRRAGCALDALDLALDLMVGLDHRDRHLKDEDELAVMVEAGIVADESRIRRDLTMVEALLDRGEAPFDGTWERWRPDPSWNPLALPEGWDRLTSGDR
jgi:hypothetical protein